MSENIETGLDFIEISHSDKPREIQKPIKSLQPDEQELLEEIEEIVEIFNHEEDSSALHEEVLGVSPEELQLLRDLQANPPANPVLTYVQDNNLSIDLNEPIVNPFRNVAEERTGFGRTEYVPGDHYHNIGILAQMPQEENNENEEDNSKKRILSEIINFFKNIDFEFLMLTTALLIAVSLVLFLIGGGIIAIQKEGKEREPKYQLFQKLSGRTDISMEEWLLLSDIEKASLIAKKKPTELSSEQQTEE